MSGGHGPTAAKQKRVDEHAAALACRRHRHNLGALGAIVPKIQARMARNEHTRKGHTTLSFTRLCFVSFVACGIVKPVMCEGRSAGDFPVSSIITPWVLGEMGALCTLTFVL